jgi:hypothetical protein
MPTFGSSTIRRFASNASEMKKLAARDFEDLLQVSGMIWLFQEAIVLKMPGPSVQCSCFRRTSSGTP